MSISICAVSMLSVLTETPGITAPMQANILPPTFQALHPKGRTPRRPEMSGRWHSLSHDSSLHPGPRQLALIPRSPFLSHAYMLAGDTGASNIDPYAEKPTFDNQWIAEGPQRRSERRYRAISYCRFQSVRNVTSWARKLSSRTRILQRRWRQ